MNVHFLLGCAYIALSVLPAWAAALFIWKRLGAWRSFVLLIVVLPPLIAFAAGGGWMLLMDALTAGPGPREGYGPWGVFVLGGTFAEFYFGAASAMLIIAAGLWSWLTKKPTTDDTDEHG